LNSFERIVISKVYRDGDKQAIVRLLTGGGRTQTSGFQCLTEPGPVNFIFIKESEFMNTTKLFNVALTIMTLLTLLIINPVFAEVDKKETAKSNETVASMEKINLNQADAKTLTTLKGIGKDRAVKIIEYREQNGPFLTIEDIMKVKGIGKKIFEQNKNVLSV
jgi:competence protein ComEA